jgi:hypothetical protein
MIASTCTGAAFIGAWADGARRRSDRTTPQAERLRAATRGCQDAAGNAAKLRDEVERSSLFGTRVCPGCRASRGTPRLALPFSGRGWCRTYRMAQQQATLSAKCWK